MCGGRAAHLLSRSASDCRVPPPPQVVAAQERAAASEAVATQLEARAAAAERQLSGQEAVARELTGELLQFKVRLSFLVTALVSLLLALSSSL